MPTVLGSVPCIERLLIVSTPMAREWRNPWWGYPGLSRVIQCLRVDTVGMVAMCTYNISLELLSSLEVSYDVTTHHDIRSDRPPALSI